MRLRSHALVVVLVASACSGGGDPGGGGPTGTLPPGSETPLVVPAIGLPPGPTLIPGIYLPPEVLVASADASGATLIAALPCDEVFDVLAAGEWEVMSRTEPSPEVAVFTMFAYGLATAMVLQRGDDQVLVRGFGSALIVDDPEEAPPSIDDCILRLAWLQSAPLTLTGPMPVDGPVTAFPVRCLILAGAMFVSMGYQAPGAWIDLTFELASSQPGEHPVAGGSLELSGFPIDRPPWEIFATLLGTDEDESVGVGLEVEAAADVVGTATVTSSEPLEGTVRLTELVAQPDGVPVTLEAPFACSGEG